MLSGVYSAATALRTAELQQDVLATNLAHMNVPGFRRSSVSVETFVEELEALAGEEPGYGTQVGSLVTDWSSGPVANTGRQLDVAIEGDGFFNVQGADETLYTRNGVLQVRADGLLVGNHGMPVLGTNGPLVLPTDASPEQVTIGRDGSVSVGTTQVGQLQLTRFEDNAALKQVGTTLFSAEQAIEATGPITVQQGMREQSNVAPVDELVTMIVAMRYHEAAQRVLSTLDNAIANQTDPQG